MKKIYTFIATLLVALSLWAQTPQMMSYQAVIRNSSDALVTNTNIGMQISILQGSASGSTVYVERHFPTTNTNGLVSIEIGNGTAVSGTFAIDWANGPYFIKTETDLTGGSNFTIEGVSQILSVPYALHAQSAHEITGDIKETDPVFSAWDKSTGILISESQISDLKDYLTEEKDPSFIKHFNLAEAEKGDLLQFDGEKWMKFTPDYLTDYMVTEDDIIAHEAAISISESQISDLQEYLTEETDPTFLMYFNFSEASEGDLLKFNGEQWVRFTPDFAEENHTHEYASGLKGGFMSAEDKVKLDNLEPVDGSETRIDAGANVIVTGSGTTQAPYVISSPGIGGGALLPMLTTQDIVELNPEAGLLVYNTTDNILQLYTGANWVPIYADDCWPAPTQANAGSGQFFTDFTTSTTLAANMPEDHHGTGKWSIISGTGGSFADDTNPATTFTGAECESYLLRWTITTDCGESSDDAYVSFCFPEDGFYIMGGGTALENVDSKGMMNPAVNEAQGNTERAGLFELFIAVKGGPEGFQIVQVVDNAILTYGPGPDFAAVAETDLHQDEPRHGFWRGTLAQTESHFTVPEDGLYHIAIDTQLNKVVMAKVDWGFVGDATPGGWESNTEMMANFDLVRMTFVAEEVPMNEGSFRFRYSNGWKMILDAPDNTIAVNTNLGNSLNNLVPGGPDIYNSERAEYKFTLTWKLGENFTANQQKTGELDPLPEIPEAMFVVGAATAYGWAEPGTIDDAIMHKIAGGLDYDGIFWKILHLEGGEQFKISAAKWASPNLNYDDVDVWDENGYAIVDKYQSWTVANSGMYMLVLDLRDDQVAVSITDVNVYGIGDAFGAWDGAVPANKFTVDHTAKTVTSPALPADGNIRMYAAHGWIPDWWHAEFNVFDGKILYRADGGDQDAVPGTAGQVVTLSFDDSTGSID